MEPQDLLDGHPAALSVFREVSSRLGEIGPFEVRTTKSQIAFRRARGFAYIWRPGQYLDRPRADVVLSIALGRHDTSPRFREVAHPSPRHWMHHLELAGADEIDAEVVGWLREAYDRAG